MHCFCFSAEFLCVFGEDHSAPPFLFSFSFGVNRVIGMIDFGVSFNVAEADHRPMYFVRGKLLNLFDVLFKL